MLADLESALANRPLGNMEFEDIYSVSDPMAKTADQVKIEPIPSPYSPPVAPAPPPPVPPVPQAPKKEIRIPDLSPSDRPEPKSAPHKPIAEPTPRKPQTRQKPQKPKNKPQSLRRVLLLLAIAVCLVILLVVSLALRFGSPETPTLVEQPIAAMLSVLERSESLWLMI